MATATRRVSIPTIDSDSLNRVLWAVAVCTYGIGDTATTTIVLALGGVESAWLAGLFVSQFGIAGLFVHKAIFLTIPFVIWRYYPSVGGVGPDPYRMLVPALLIPRGVWLVGHNLNVISAQLGVV